MASYIIGVDVGYGNTKTAHSCFSSGIKLLSSKPPISTRVIETTSVSIPSETVSSPSRVPKRKMKICVHLPWLALRKN